jgi:hypothetical protein
VIVEAHNGRGRLLEQEVGLRRVTEAVAVLRIAFRSFLTPLMRSSRDISVSSQHP